MRLPFTTKDDLRDNYPMGLFARPRNELVRVHASSGTAGKPTIVGYTRNDMKVWTNNVSRIACMGGATPDDIAQIAFGYGMFTGALGLHAGLENIGASVMPMSSGNTDRQLQFMVDLGSTILCCTPSYAAYLAESIHERGLRDQIRLKAGIFGAEAWSEEMRRDIEAKLGIKAYDIYGLTELGGMGVAFECSAQDGLHINEDSFIAEVVDPETGEALPEGQAGELVLSAVTQEAMPLLRYRTHDLTRIIPGDCACGRKHRRIDRILGRSDDMFILKGVNIYPMQIEQVLMGFPEVGHNYLIRLEKQGLLETLRVLVEIREEHFVEDMRVLRSLQESIARRLRDEILITPKVDLVQGGSLPRTEGKARRVEDLRDAPEGGN